METDYSKDTYTLSMEDKMVATEGFGVPGIMGETEMQAIILFLGFSNVYGVCLVYCPETRLYYWFWHTLLDAGFISLVDEIKLMLMSSHVFA